jgi:hypothetical protein
MLALSLSLMVAALLASSVGAQAQFIPRYSGHQAWADYHISSLAPEIRARVLGFRKDCGVPFAATHAFARPTYHRAPVIALHYESLWCGARQSGICRGEDCLHEVYVREGPRYRLTFRGYVKDVEVDLAGNVRIVTGGG